MTRYEMVKKKTTQATDETPSQLRKDLVKLLRENTGRWDTYTVWADWIAMCACTISNSCDPVHAEEREAEYLRIVRKYSKEEVNRFGVALGMLIALMEKERFADFLGETYMLLEIGSQDGGQFFTPYHICKLLAQISIGTPESMAKSLEDKGFVTVNEPACGSGAMVIAFAEAMSEAGFNPQTQMWACLTDIDIKSVHMAYVQLSLLGIPAQVICGNTLTLEHTSLWVTPFHVSGGWERKLKGALSPAEELGMLTDLLGEETNLPSETEIDMSQIVQLALF